MTPPLLFYFRKQEVGSFAGDAYPQMPGRYRYDPCLGFGHLRLVEALNKGAATCSFTNNGMVFEFTVKSIPTLGVLEIVHIAPGCAAES